MIETIISVKFSSFLKFAKFYKRFIQDFAKTATVFTYVLKSALHWLFVKKTVNVTNKISVIINVKLIYKSKI